MVNDIWYVLSGSTIEFADEETGTIIAWNQSATFNVYRVFNMDTHGVEGFQEIDAFTNYSATSGTAAGIAREWFETQNEEDED